MPRSVASGTLCILITVAGKLLQICIVLSEDEGDI
jgi:hypothetical protein